MNAKPGRSEYSKPGIAPLPESKYSIDLDAVGTGKTVRDWLPEEGVPHGPCQTELTRFYQSGYASGFAHALQLVEHLLARGLSIEMVLKSLHEMLAEDIRPK
jgi:hypothetical protein